MSGGGGGARTLCVHVKYPSSAVLRHVSVLDVVSYIDAYSVVCCYN